MSNQTENIKNKVLGWNPIKNAKKNLTAMRDDPYITAKFNYRVTKWFVILICLLISFQIYRMVISYNGGSGTMNLLGQGALVLVGVVLISQMYLKVLNPLRKTVEHYDANPTTVTSHYVNVEKEVDDIIEYFDNKEKANENKTL